MIYKVLIFAAATLTAVDARAFPETSGNTLEQLIGELKEIEKVRHDAITKAAEKPQFKEDEKMVRYLATWAEYDALLIEIRKALKDIPWLVDDDRLETPFEQDSGKIQKIVNDFKILRARAEVIENKLVMETRGVPTELLMDKDFVTVLDALKASSKKLLQIGFRMLIEVTSNLFKQSLQPEEFSGRRAMAENAVM